MRDSRLDGWQHGERSVWFALIPIRYGIKVVSPIVGMPVFYRCAQRLRKRNRRVQMKAIDGPSSALQFRADDRRSE
jgi:hypothetical protein